MPKPRPRKQEAELKTAPELIDEMVKEPTLDEFMDRDPAQVDFPELVKVLRADRARFLTKEEARKDKRAGIISPEEGDPEPVETADANPSSD